MLRSVVKGPKCFGSARLITLSNGISCLLEPHLSFNHKMNKLMVLVVCVTHTHT